MNRVKDSTDAVSVIFLGIVKGFSTSSALMPNELPLPDDLKHLIEKRGGKDRRNKKNSRLPDDEDGGSGGEVRRAGQRDRRGSKNYRDLLNDDDE